MTTEDERLRFLVDPIYHDDAQYHAQVSTYRHWLRMTRLALEDENLDVEIIDRVLNRLVFGTPDAGDSYQRRADNLDMIKKMMFTKGIVAPTPTLSRQ